MAQDRRCAGVGRGRLVIVSALLTDGGICQNGAIGHSPLPVNAGDDVTFARLSTKSNRGAFTRGAFFVEPWGRWHKQM